MSLLETDRRRTPWTRGNSRERGRLRVSYPAIPDSVGAARWEVADFAAEAGASEEQINRIRLAVSEAVTNVVLYAYPARPGYVHLTAGVAGGELWVLIADSGCGIHAGPDSSGLGLGLALIAQMTDGFSVVERSSGGTELQLRFVLEASGPPDRGQLRGSIASDRRPASSRFSTTK